MRKILSTILICLMLFSFVRVNVVRADLTYVWSKVGDGLKSCCGGGYACFVDPVEPSTVYVAGGFEGTYVSYNEGRDWKQLTTKWGAIAVSPSNNQIIYVGTSFGVYKTLDGGKTWNKAGLDKYDIYVLAVDPKDPNVVYAGTLTNGLFKTTDGGQNWAHIFSERTVNDIVISPSNSQTIYVALEGAGIYASYDGGTSFKELTSTISGIYKSAQCIAVSKTNPQVIYAGFRSNLLESTDGGNSWIFIDKNVPEMAQNILSIAIDPLDVNTVYVGTNKNGLYKTSNGGITWQRIGFEGKSIYSIAIDSQHGIIYIATSDYVYKFDPLDRFVISSIQDQIANKPFDITITAQDSAGNTLTKYNGTVKLTSTIGTVTPSTVQFDHGVANVSVRINSYGNNVSITVIDEASGKNVTSNSFNLIPYNITTYTSVGGKISPSGTIKAMYGDSISFTISPFAGFGIKDVKVDGNSIGAVQSYTFNNIDRDHTLDAVFERRSTTIGLKIGEKNFFVNDELRTLDAPPIIKNGRTLVPIRAIVEALGGSVSWDANSKKVTISLGSTTIELWIGKPTAKVNGVSKQIDLANSKVVPEIINGRTMLPLRFVAENLGCTVKWDDKSKIITIIF